MERLHRLKLAKPISGALLVVLYTGAFSYGAIWFELPHVVVAGNGAASTTGLLDVVVRADAVDLPKLVSALNVDLSFTTATSIQFKSPQAAPNPLITGTPLNFSPHPQRVLAALDLASGATSLVDGMGLVRVPFEVPAGVTGVFPLAFGPANQLADMDANPISLQTSDTGSITINALPAVAGDYDADGIVGPEDYQLWRSSFGSNNLPAVDGSGNNIIDAADYVLWRKNMGSGSSAGTGQAANLTAAVIPEPATVLVLLAGLPMVLVRRSTLSF
jgi:hypothetical protein